MTVSCGMVLVSEANTVTAEGQFGASFGRSFTITRMCKCIG
jgi:hypothetical protein